jgi:predicted phosphodiesterase
VDAYFAEFVGVRAGKARRIDPGGAAESVDLQAGVIGKRQPAGRAGNGVRLQDGGYPSQRTIDALREDVERGVKEAVGKGLIAALLTATFVGWALRRSPRTTVAAGLLGVMVPAAFLGWTTRGYDLNAFKEPTYHGALRYAPALIELVQSRVNAVGTMQAELGETVREFSTYYAQPQTFAAGGTMPNTVRVLAVSDLHVDPVGFKLESTLADTYHVSAILDAGDLSNFATPIEITVLRNYLDTRYPRVFVPGNHESPEVVRTVDAMRNVTLLKDGMATVDGITFYGLADPMSRREGWEPDIAATEAESKAAAERLRSSEASGGKLPDIITVHNPRGGEAFAGLAPLIVSGHTHTADLGRFGTSWYVNGGTVGGVNFSKLAPDPHIAHGATILYYTKSLPRRLIAIDQISVFGKASQSSIKRTVVDAKLLEEIKTLAAKEARQKLAPKAAPAKAQ